MPVRLGACKGAIIMIDYRFNRGKGQREELE